MPLQEIDRKRAPGAGRPKGTVGSRILRAVLAQQKRDELARAYVNPKSSRNNEADARTGNRSAKYFGLIIVVAQSLPFLFGKCVDSIQADYSFVWIFACEGVATDE